MPGVGRNPSSQRVSDKVLRTPLLHFIEGKGPKPHPMLSKKLVLTTQTRAGGRPPDTQSRPKSRTEYSITQRTDALLRGLSLILEHHDARESVLEELSKQVHCYLDSSIDELVWLNRCKHLLCYPLAKYLRNKSPKTPDVSFKPSGLLRGWMKARLNAFNNKNTHLWYSWFQAKRATLPLSEKIVRETYDKHFETLTKPDPVLTADKLPNDDQGPNYRLYGFRREEGRPLTEGDHVIHKIFSDPVFVRILNEIASKVRKKFRQSKPQNDMCAFDDFPKTSACFQNTRNDGGQAQMIRDHIGISDDLPRENELFSMEFCPRVLSTNIRSSVLTKTCPQGMEDWSTLQNLAKECAKETAPLKCTIQAVLEPNKIRVISKGEALPYYTCKGLQKIIHSTLKKYPCFRLIGRPLCPTDIKDLLVKADPSWSWCSVDYSAATDGLSYIYSSRILDWMVSELGDDFSNLSRRVLGPHDLYYPPADKKQKAPEFRGTQKNGQLMGSILSFPILCLANFGVYLASTRDIRQGWSYEETINSVLINGDDMLYASPYRNFLKNVKYGGLLGLEMSVGKAYVHKSYMNINSQSIVCDLSSKDRHIRAIDFLNVGLFFGQHKVQGRQDDGLAKSHHEEDNGIVANINTLLEGSLPGKECSVLEKCLSINKETINKECAARTYRKTKVQRNLFISQQLGGMGVKAPEGWKFKLTKSDLYIAHGFLEHNPNLGRSRQYPSLGYEVMKFEDFKESLWEPRVTGDDFKENRVPYKEVSFNKLRKLCRSPCFSFFMDNRSSRVSYTHVPSSKTKICPSSDDLEHKQLLELFEEEMNACAPRCKRRDLVKAKEYHFNELEVRLENLAGELLDPVNYIRKLLPSEIPDAISLESMFDPSQECDATDIFIRLLQQEHGESYNPVFWAE